MRHLRTFRYALTAATFLTLSGSAFALDGNDLVAKINAGLQGTTLNPASINVDGSNVTLTGVKVRVPSPEAAGEGAPIGDIALTGVEEDAGGYTIEKATFGNVNVTNEGVTVTASDISLSNITIPADATKGTIDSMMMYEEGHIGPVSVTKAGSELFSLASTDFSLTKRDGDAGFDFEATAAGLKGDLTKVEDPQAKDVLQKIGLTSLQGEINMAGGWDLKTGTLEVTNYSFDFKDIGNLSLAFSISGYTLELIKSLQDQMKAMETNPNKEEAQAAAGMAMMGLMQQLSFNSASVSFEDASITKRLLDYAGSQQGVTGEQMAQSLKAMVPIMIGQLNIPELQNSISEAVNTYLDDPKSLTIAAAPEKSVPFPQILGAAMGAPNSIPTLLGVTVSANDEM